MSEPKLIAPSVATALVEGVDLYRKELDRAHEERRQADRRVAACEEKLSKAMAMLGRIIAQAPESALQAESDQAPSDGGPK